MKRGPEHWRSGSGWIERASDKIFYLSQDYFDQLNKVSQVLICLFISKKS